MKKSRNILLMDWDNLIILDSCRFDAFKKLHRFNGVLQRKTSLGTNTGEWFEAMFRKRKHNNIVYYSANPWITKVMIDEHWKGTEFHALFEIVSHGKKASNAYLANILPPDRVTELVIKTQGMFKGKKKVIHYLQPHSPFFSLKYRTSTKRLGEMIKEKKITAREIKDGYYQNLKLVLEEVEVLLTALNGKTVITADHGECLGERKQWGHGKDIEPKTIRALRAIPWIEIDKTYEDTRLQLQDLGYC